MNNQNDRDIHVMLEYQIIGIWKRLIVKVGAISEADFFPGSHLSVHLFIFKFENSWSDIASKSLIFMRRYEVTDLPCSFLAIFYKIEAWTRSNILNSRIHGHSTQVINIHENISEHRFPLAFPWRFRRSHEILGPRVR